MPVRHGAFHAEASAPAAREEIARPRHGPSGQIGGGSSQPWSECTTDERASCRGAISQQRPSEAIHREEVRRPHSIGSARADASFEKSTNRTPYSMAQGAAASPDGQPTGGTKKEAPGGTLSRQWHDTPGTAATASHRSKLPSLSGTTTNNRTGAASTERNTDLARISRALRGQSEPFSSTGGFAQMARCDHSVDDRRKSIPAPR